MNQLTSNSNRRVLMIYFLLVPLLIGILVGLLTGEILTGSISGLITGVSFAAAEQLELI